MAHFVRVTVGTLLACLCLQALAQRPFSDRDSIPTGSRVEYLEFHSQSLGRDIPYGLYLPPSYAGSTRQYPVLYFLHGADENEKRWSTRGRTDLLLDRMVAEGRIGEFIVAIPYADNSFYTNARLADERWGDMIIQEFIPMIESTYRTRASHATRGISGISMGGYGALKLAMTHPELFGSVSAHSAMLIDDIQLFSLAGRRTRMFRYMFDKIFGISEDLAYWNTNNPLLLAREPEKFDGLQIYFDCGTEDEYGFFAGARLLSRALKGAGYPHEFALYPGGHGWDYARQHTADSLGFHWNAFQGQ